MIATNATIKGVYKLIPSQELIDEAISVKYGNTNLTKEQLQTVISDIQEELAKVVLIDLVVYNAPDNYRIEDIPQGSGLEKPYLPMYLTLDDAKAISRKKPDNGKVFRISFYLHDFLTDDKIKVADNDFYIPTPKTMDFETYQNNPYRPRTKICNSMAANGIL